MRAIGTGRRRLDGYTGFVECRVRRGHYEALWEDQHGWASTELLLQACITQFRNNGNYEGARSAALRLLRDFGRHPAALFGLARIEEEAHHDLIAARRHLTEGLHLSPTSQPGHLAYLALLIKEGRWSDANRHLRQMMTKGAFINAWREGRVPYWSGSTLEGKTVLIDSRLAMGFGDFIHFSRFAAALKVRGANVILRTRKPLVKLLASVSAIDSVVSYSDPIPHADFVTDISLLWLFLGLGMEEVSANVPYLSADLASPRSELVRDGKMSVGVVSRSGDRHPWNPYIGKNLPAREIPALANDPGIRLYHIEAAPRTSALISGHESDLATVQEIYAGDFPKTANLLAQMDVVISVDTAMGHLAGALGKTGILLLPYSSDWRWLHESRSTPWYPSFRLIRQASPGDWASVVHECSLELRAFARQYYARAGPGGPGQ